MSVVFEALKRAGEGKKEKVEISENQSRVSAEETFSRKSPGSDGDSAPHLSGHNHEAGSPSWRERLEKILFGWNMKRFAPHPIVALEKNSPVAEQYKILRERIKKLRAETGVRCLSVTSPVKGDGKTMVAVNLAAAMALDYEGKILLIDGDLRRPEIHRYFGIHPSPGLGDYLSSSTNGNLMSYLRDTFIPGFKVLPGGKSSHLSSELLGMEKMKILMEEIRARFPEHQIILDAPPVLSTPDPLVLGRHVDGIIVVVRAGKTPRDYLVKAVQSLNSAKILGVVLNDVDRETSSKYYYYSERNA